MEKFSKLTDKIDLENTDLTSNETLEALLRQVGEKIRRFFERFFL
ncbi:hypothetical protein LEP1GSC005_1656 [Leptospira santarosai str. ST188]|uniref:Uncharacterized protein n=1 Tax=Leptospira santarosai str. MOR084 TaxID=1049984 RepID=A0A0E2BC80_9LEPT|nr:hypothetical protein LEP1GSC179_2793 [Leptospira santarosai str. MOR084]EMF88900.1 hypothetical protein LEP1GSC005_1656 [Leptospira santarosai str. ST188]